MKNVEIYKFEESTESKDLIAAPEPIVSIQPAACTETPHTPLDIARSYEKRGWLPLPVPYGKKECHLRAWPDLRHGRYNVSDHFSEAPLNVGISLGEPSGGLVDIDLDCPEATRIAEAILPHTDCIFGRKGNARSHWIYRTDVAGAREFFSDPTSGEMLVEYRGNGCMTVFPGSVHGSGELVEFEKDEDPTSVPRDSLLRRVRQLAAASLIARHWREGRRHNAALALSGCLLRSGFSENDAIWFLDSICMAANDLAERADRIRCVTDTSRSLERHEAVAGWTALKEAFGPDIAAKLAEWLGFRIPQEIMPPRYSAVAQTGGTMPFSDLWNAERFAADHRDKAVYCHDLDRWFAWDGTRWAIDKNGAVERLAMETAKTLALQAATHGGTDELRAAAKAQSRHSLQDMTRIAQSIARISQNELDADAWQLNCESGTLDLRTGACRVHDPNDKISKLAPVTFSPEATCPTWIKFLDRVMAGNEKLISFLERAVGYSLTGVTDEQCLFVAVGPGANGKSTFLNALRLLLGEYAQQTPMDTLMVSKNNNVSNDLAALPRARLVCATEAEHGRRLAETKIKYMTGGDAITARYLYGEFFTFVPQFKLWLATNELPKIEGTDDGTWRRIYVIPFDVTIPKEERDPRLAEKLEAELSGILNWAIAGCLRWQREGLNPPPEVLAATHEYRSDMDAVAQFLEDCCIREPQAEVPVGNLYREYADWCRQNGDQAFSKQTFGRRLRNSGLGQKHTARSRLWVGVRLKPADFALQIVG